MSDFFSVETAVNYEQKSLCVLLLDVSHSMEGARLKSLQEGIEAFHKEISLDPYNRIKSRLEMPYKTLLLKNFPTSLMSSFFLNLISKAPTPLTQILKSQSPSNVPAVSTSKLDILE